MFSDPSIEAERFDERAVGIDELVDLHREQVVSELESELAAFVEATEGLGPTANWNVPESEVQRNTRPTTGFTRVHPNPDTRYETGQNSRLGSLDECRSLRSLHSLS